MNLGLKDHLLFLLLSRLPKTEVVIFYFVFFCCYCLLMNKYNLIVCPLWELLTKRSQKYFLLWSYFYDLFWICVRDEYLVLASLIERFFFLWNGSWNYIYVCFRTCFTLRILCLYLGLYYTVNFVVRHFNTFDFTY